MKPMPPSPSVFSRRLEQACQLLFFIFVVRPLVLMIIGLRVQNKSNLPTQGPAIIVANHNSHLDTWVLMTLFPLRSLTQVRPVAAAEYFYRNPLWTWFFRVIFNVIAINRSSGKQARQLFEHCSEAIAHNDILILYPEGSRGLPEEMKPFKKGIAHLSQQHPEVPIYPVFLHGLGKALPKGDFLLVPFFCDVVIGSPLQWSGSQQDFMTTLNQRMKTLSEDCYCPSWD